MKAKMTSRVKKSLNKQTVNLMVLGSIPTSKVDYCIIFINLFNHFQTKLPRGSVVLNVLRRNGCLGVYYPGAALF